MYRLAAALLVAALAGPVLAQDDYSTYPVADDRDGLEALLAEIDDPQEQNLVRGAFNQANGSSDFGMGVDPLCYATRFHRDRDRSQGMPDEGSIRPAAFSRIWGAFQYGQTDRWIECVDLDRLRESARRDVHKLWLRQHVRRRLGPLAECARAARAVWSARQAAELMGRDRPLPEDIHQTADSCLAGSIYGITPEGAALLQSVIDTPIPTREEMMERAQIGDDQPGFIPDGNILTARLAHHSDFRDDIAVYDAFVECVLEQGLPALEATVGAGNVPDRDAGMPWGDCEDRHPLRGF